MSTVHTIHVDNRTNIYVYIDIYMEEPITGKALWTSRSPRIPSTSPPTLSPHFADLNVKWLALDYPNKCMNLKKLARFGKKTHKKLHENYHIFMADFITLLPQQCTGTGSALPATGHYQPGFGILWHVNKHYNDVIMSAVASHITVVPIVCSIVQAPIKENIKAPCHWPLWGEPPVAGGFPAQRASNAENVSIWWRHLG